MNYKSEIQKIKFSKFNFLQINIPGIQRIKSIIKIEEITKYQEDIYNKNKNFNFFGVLTISYCISEQKYYLIDGQHRYFAMIQLYDKLKKDFNINIEIINTIDIKDVEEVFNIINKNMPISNIKFNNNDDKNLVEQISIHFELKYKNIFKTNNCKRPSININIFNSSINNIIQNIKIRDKKYIIRKIEFFNESLKNYTIEDYNNKFKLSISENIFNKLLKKSNDNILYLGLFKYMVNKDNKDNNDNNDNNDKYFNFHYTWTIDIINIFKNEIIEEYNKN